jgi:hypothetical protein
MFYKKQKTYQMLNHLFPQSPPGNANHREKSMQTAFKVASHFDTKLMQAICSEQTNEKKPVTRTGF